MEHTEKCWSTGEWNDMCDCQLCDHKYECSGREMEDEDDDE